MEPITLTTERLVLRPFTPDDAPAVHAACQDPDIPRWTPVPSPYTPEHARTWIEQTVPQGWAQDVHYNLAACRKDTGALVSAIGLVRVTGFGGEGGERQAELGYWTAAGQRGRGFTTEAARALCRWGFEALGAERLEWIATAGNHPSRAVARAVGFRDEGVRRAHIVHRGARHDAWCASLLPTDLGLPQQTPYTPYGE
jgi:RimJ/RimL family protein N-acetyltransferase